MNGLFKTLFVERILSTLLLFLTVFGGVVVFSQLTRENNPDLKIPYILVTTEWPGADSESVEKRITNKLEEKIKGVADLKFYESSSFNSFSIIAVEFDADADADECLNNLRAEIDKVSELPQDAMKPSLKKSSVDDRPVLTVNISGPINMKIQNEVAEKLKDRLLMVSGVREVNINGERDEQVFIHLRKNIMDGLKLSSDSIRKAIVDGSVDQTLSAIESDNFNPVMRVKGRYRDTSELEKLVVARINNRPVYLGEVADVRRDLEKVKTIIRLSQKGGEFQESLSLDILRSPGTDIIGMVNKAKAAIEQFSGTSEWVQGLTWSISDDMSVTVEDSLNDVISNGVQAVILVFIVLLVALSWREGIIAGLAIPVTVFSMILLLPVLGYTMNKLVIVGLVLALGMLVDVFILMMEGMHDAVISKGMNFTEAVKLTVKNYALPAFSGQLTTICAFMPLAFIGGTSGKFIRIIPIVVSITLLLSYVVALLITLPMSGIFFAKMEKAEGDKVSLMDRITAKAEVLYRTKMQHTLLRNRITASVSIVVAFILFAFSIYTGRYLDSEMYPQDDSKTLGLTFELEPGTTLEKTDRLVKRIGDLLKSRPWFESVVSYTGMRSPMASNAALLQKEATNLAGFGCRFVPADEREEKLSYKLVPPLRKEIETILRDEFAGAVALFHLESSGASSKAPISVRISGTDMKSLRKATLALKGEMATIPGTLDITDNLGLATFNLDMFFDREALDFFAITPDSLSKQLRYACGTAEVTKVPFNGSTDELSLQMGFQWPSRRGLPGGPRLMNELRAIQVFNKNNESLACSPLLKNSLVPGDNTITHYNGVRTVTVSSQLNNRTAGEVSKEIMARIDNLVKDKRLPGDCTYTIGGENEDAAEAYGNIPILLLVALFLVVAILALQFKSFMQTFIIMASLPFSLFGVIMGFFFTGMNISFVAVIGIISLVGIAVNNAIVMVETMNSHRDEGTSVVEAAIRGAGERLRPILVTTTTTIIGLIPLAISSPTWQPLCFAIIYGLFASTVISLLIVPCLYRMLTKESA